MSSNQAKSPIRLHKISWVSHRGYAVDTDENTMEAFQRAAELGFDRMETDLRTSKDGQLILAHDESYERLGGPRVPVWELSANAITKIHLAKGGSPARLDAVMAEFSDRNWTFDIKPDQADRTIRFLANLINMNDWEQRVTSGQYRFLFWNKQHQLSFLDKFPNAVCYARYGECQRVGIAYLLRMGVLARPEQGKIYSLPAKYKKIKLFKREIVEYFHSRGAKLCAFLPETDEETNAAIEVGFDEILTNLAPGS